MEIKPILKQNREEILLRNYVQEKKNLGETKKNKM